MEVSWKSVIQREISVENGSAADRGGGGGKRKSRGTGSDFRHAPDLTVTSQSQ